MDDFRAEGQKLHQANRDRWLAVYDTLNPEQKEKVRVFKEWPSAWARWEATMVTGAIAD